MDEKKYSIIIPHYNIPEKLDRLLNSIPVEKKDTEVIVVDDRSDKYIDELREVKNKWSKKGVYFYRNNNGIKGPGTCRNIGIKHAKGKWLIFADADDYFLEGLHETIEKYYQSEADMVYFIPDSIDDETGERSVRHISYENTINAYLTDPCRKNELNLRYKSISPCSKMIKRKTVLDNKTLFGTSIVAQDVVFITKFCYVADKIEVSRDKIYCIVKTKGSLTEAKDIERQNIRTKVIINRARFLRRELSREDYRELNINGTNRLIGMVAAGYPISEIVYTAMIYLVNGIKPVDMSMINPKTAWGTFIEMRKKEK